MVLEWNFQARLTLALESEILIAMKDMENTDRSYKIITENGNCEIEIKKSRFIGQTYAVQTPAEAEAAIAAAKKKYWDARHNCHAYVLGSGSEVSRCSDDGEPSGTAGKPILEVLGGSGITNALIIVTRYFGGTLLGTGGLVRAYTQAAQGALEQSGIAVMTYGQKLTFVIGYHLVDRMQHSFEQMGIELCNPQYGADVSYDVIVRAGEVEEVRNKVIEMTSGSAKILEGEKDFYPIRERGQQSEDR